MSREPGCRCFVVKAGPPLVRTPPLDGSACPVHEPRRELNFREALDLLTALDPAAGAQARADIVADVSAPLAELAELVRLIDPDPLDGCARCAAQAASGSAGRQAGSVV